MQSFQAMSFFHLFVFRFGNSFMATECTTTVVSSVVACMAGGVASKDTFKKLFFIIVISFNRSYIEF